MKKFIFLTLLACVFTLPSNGSVTINRTTFPDERLREALVEEGIDADGNGVLTNEEIENATYIYVVGAKNLKGLELLPFLETIILVGDEESYSSITSFDAKPFKKLSRFEIENYAITSLDLTYSDFLGDVTVKDCLEFSAIKIDGKSDAGLYLNHLPNLTSMANCEMNNLGGVEFYKTGIQDIDISHHPTLYWLILKGDEDDLYYLNSINVSGCENLWSLNFENVKLSSIRLNELSQLYALDLFQCQTVDLAVVNMQNLGSIRCGGSSMENITIRNCPVLHDVDCSGNYIHNLIIDDSPELYSVHAEDNYLMWLDMQYVENVEDGEQNWFNVDNQTPTVQAVKISPTEVGLRVHERFDVSRVLHLRAKGIAQTPRETTVDGIRYFVFYNNGPDTPNLVGSDCFYEYDTKWPYPCLESNSKDNNLPVKLNIYSWTKHPASLSLSDYNISAMFGEPLVAPVVTRSQDYDGQLSYRSSDTNVVTVDQNGQLTAVGVGRATITITGAATDYRLAPASVSYTVEITLPTGIEAKGESVTLNGVTSYDLQGRKVYAPVQKGVYVVNGRKVVRK